MIGAPFVSRALHGEDVVLWRALGGRDGVTYVEVHAGLASVGSITGALYERGWRGISAGTAPAVLDALDRDRPADTTLAVAIGDEDDEDAPRLPAAGSLPAADGAAPRRRLATVLAELGVDAVDVLALAASRDTAGAAVRGLLAGPVRPVVCVVPGDAPLPAEGADGAVGQLLDAGYRHCMFDGLNHWLTTDESLVPALSVPANPGDGFVTEEVERLTSERDALTAALAELVLENADLRRGQEQADGAPTLETPARHAPAAAPRASDLPVPAAGTGTPAPATTRPAPAPRALDPRVRARRRRETFQQLLAGRADEPLPRLNGAQLPRILALSSGEHSAKDAVVVLYREILGRAPDPDGLTVWASRIDKGETLFDVASAMASTDEALGRTRSDVAVVRADLRTWERMIAVRSLGIGSWRGLPGETADSVRHRIFVNALFEVSLQRAPQPGERAHEVGKLQAGVGREWLLRTYAARPETTARLFGQRAGGVRGRVRAVLDRRRRLDVFRDLVGAAESRQLALLLQELAQAELLDTQRATSNPRPETV